VNGSGSLFGLLLLVALVSAAAVVGLEVRRIALPGWTGAPARLAESIGGIAVVVLVAQLLGSVHLFRWWALLPAVCAAAGVAALARRRFAPRVAASPLNNLRAPGESPRAAVALAALVVTFAVTRSIQAAFDALHAGILSYDSLWYHLPFAARFAQTGSLTQLHYVGNGPTTFYPANGELVHAVGMLVFHSDLLSPVVNIGWLAVALLAGWCVGRPYGAAPASMVAVCAAAFLPVLGGAQAGTAGTDVAVLALLVSAVALLVNGRRSLAAVAFAALAAGLAGGTKLDAWAPAVMLGVPAVAGLRGRRRAGAAMWAGGLIAGSAYWYVRNLAIVGNPFPWFGRFASLPTTSTPTDCGTTSVAHYLGHSHVLVSQLPSALGARWWLVIAIAAIGTASAFFTSQPLLRGLGIVTVVAAAAYLFTPATAGGHDARCFSFNTRFATPALALGLLLFVLALTRFRHAPLAAVVILGVALLLTIHPSHSAGAILVACALTAMAFYVATGMARGVPLTVNVVLIVALATAAIVGGRHEQQVYSAGRYGGVSFSDPIADIVHRLRSVRSSRIGFVGLSEAYPFYGADLSNRVDYLARRKRARYLPYSACRAWVEALHAGRYVFVVTANESTVDAQQTRWTRRYPGAREILASPPHLFHRGSNWTWQLFELDPDRTVQPRAACNAHA
jgi:hypothetical protein